MKTVYTCFSTDVIHDGHLNLINEAKKYGNVVIAKSVNNPNYMLTDAEESLIKGILKKFYDGKILNRK